MEAPQCFGAEIYAQASQTFAGGGGGGGGGGARVDCDKGGVSKGHGKLSRIGAAAAGARF